MNGAHRHLLTYPQCCDLLRSARPSAKIADCHAGLGITSIEAWPAAGGGLLVGVAEPAFAGRAPSRRAIKTIFIRIDMVGMITLIAPYVTLEEEARYCLRALVAAELYVPENLICLDIRRHGCPAEADIRSESQCIVDIGPQAELTVEACAAVARVMLVCAAAEIWGLPTKLCHTAQGIVIGAMSDQVVRYSEIVAHAAWRKMPGSVQLRSGRLLDLSSISQGCRGSVMQAASSCEPEVRSPARTDG